MNLVAGDRTSSMTMKLTGKESVLDASIYPEIELDSRYNYSCALLDFYSYNSVPNVHNGNNLFHYYTEENNYSDDSYTNEKKVQRLNIIVVPVGAYEFKNLIEYLHKEFEKNKVNISLEVNVNTLKCIIKTNVTIDFSADNSIGMLFGFGKYLLPKHRGVFVADNVVQVHHINNIRVECDLITGAYHNGQSSRTIHEFSSISPVGYKICERPTNLIYLPIVKRRINTLNVSIVDQDGNLIDFRGEKITCRFHIKRD